METKAEGAEDESPQQILRSNTSPFSFQSRTQSTMSSLLPLHVPDDIALQIASLLPVSRSSSIVSFSSDGCRY